MKPYWKLTLLDTDWIQATAEACYEQAQKGQPFLPVDEFLDFWDIMERVRQIARQREEDNG